MKIVITYQADEETKGFHVFGNEHGASITLESPDIIHDAVFEDRLAQFLFEYLHKGNFRWQKQRARSAGIEKAKKARMRRIKRKKKQATDVDH